MDFALELLDCAAVLLLDGGLPALQIDNFGAEYLDTLLLAINVAIGLFWNFVDYVLLFLLPARGFRLWVRVHARPLLARGARLHRLRRLLALVVVQQFVIHVDMVRVLDQVGDIHSTGLKKYQKY